MGRRGPKPTAGKRQKNGRLSEEKAVESARRKANGDRIEWDTMGTVMMARHRQHGLPLFAEKGKPSAMDQRAGSVIGRLVMRGELTGPQGDAAVKYAAEVDNYHQAIDAPAQPGAVDLNAGGTSTKPENVRFKRRAIARHEAARAAVQRCANQHRGSNLFAALYHFVLRDQLHPHMLADLRLALDALAVHYGMDEPEKARELHAEPVESTGTEVPAKV